MSTILGNSATTADADAAYNTEGTWDNAPPNGISVSCLGLSTRGNNPGTMGVVFELTLPDGYALIANRSGSMHDEKYGEGATKMLFVVSATGARGSTQRWEVWFNASDVDSDGWDLPVEVQVSVSDGGGAGTVTTYTYKFRKRGSGGGGRRR